MKKLLVSLAILLLAPAASLAADPAGHSGAAAHSPSPIPLLNEGLMTSVAAVVIFLICAVVLGTKVWPKISAGLKDREDKIRNEIEAAEMAQQQAKAALEQYEKNLAQARAEAQAMLDRAKTEQQAIAAELRAKSEAELNQMREKAKRDIESAKASAVIELNEYAASMATEMARNILRREINPGDQSRLISESLAELQASRN